MGVGERVFGKRGEDEDGVWDDEGVGYGGMGDDEGEFVVCVYYGVWDGGYVGKSIYGLGEGIDEGCEDDCDMWGGCKIGV